MDCDLLIAGQGLAGTLLAWEAHWEGLRVVIVDPDEKDTASKVAAGIINPITGHRLTKSWRFDELHPAAIDFYRRSGKDLGRFFYHERTILRCLDDAESIGLWEKKSQREEYHQLFSYDRESVRPADPDSFLPCASRFATRRCGNLDVPGFLAASREFFALQHRVVTELVDLTAFHSDSSSARCIRYRGISARHAVFCLGENGACSRFFRKLPLKRAKGEVLEIEIPDSTENRIVSRRGKWVLPAGNGRFLAGSTYSWDPENRLPSEAGKNAILAGLRSTLREDPAILRHRSGIRPIVRGSRPVLGQHPDTPGVAIFNGLGSKGVLNGPHFARTLIRNLIADAPIEPDVDIRFFL